MAAIGLKVDTQYLRQAARDIKTNSRNYETEYKALFADVDMLQTKWKGEDNQEFTKQIKDYEREFQKMKALMDDYADYLNNTATKYEETQHDISDDAKNVVVKNEF